MKKIPYVYPLDGTVNKWRVFIRHQGRQVFVGDYRERVNAFIAYNKAAFDLRQGLLTLQKRKRVLKEKILKVREEDELDKAIDVLALGGSGSEGRSGSKTSEKLLSEKIFGSGSESEEKT